MDWEKLYRIFLQYLQEHLDILEKSTEEFTRDFIKYLRENGYQITPEMEKMIDDFSKEQAQTVLDSINQIIQNVAEAAAVSQETGKLPIDKFVKSIARKVFEEKYADGFNLSERIWDWEDEMKEGLKKVVSDGIKRGIGVNKLVYDMQYKIERLTRQEFKDVLAEVTPKWLDELRDAAKGYIKNPEMKDIWDETLKRVEKYINRLSRQGTYTASRTVFEKIKEAVEKGNQKLIEKAVRWWNYDKQLYRLKVISQTENARAYHLAQIEATEKDEDIIGYQWRLSRSHPRPDICDVYANIEYGLGKGVFPKDKVPRQKAHPLCLCYLLPKVRRKGMKERKNPEVPEDVLRSFAPEYVKDLEETGINVKDLWDMELGAFKRMKDLMKAPEFRPLQTIGRVKRKGIWKELDAEPLKKYLKRNSDIYPESIRKYIESHRKVDSLLVHFWKRKYEPNEPFRPKKPEDLNRWIKDVLGKEDSIVFESYGRYIISDKEKVVIIEPPNKKISVYYIKGSFEEWIQRNIDIKKIGTIKSLRKKLAGF